MMLTQVKALWKLCFNDSDDFTELYFRMRYRDERNLTLEKDGKVAAALQILPYPLTFHRNILPMGYISGACTHPDFRNGGLMGQLLRQTLEKMEHTGTAFSTLIPAEPWLFDYYARFGYATVFYQQSEAFDFQNYPVNEGTLYTDSSPESHSEETWEATDVCSEEVASFLDKQYKRLQGCTVLHPYADLQVVYAALRLDRGCSYLLREHGELKAVAFAIPSEDGSWLVSELVAVDERMKQRLLVRLATSLHPSPFTVLSSSPAHCSERCVPLGMARIVQARRVLELHAQQHPDLEWHLHLHDAQLPANNGYYSLEKGSCRYSEQVQGYKYESFTIAQLTVHLLTSENPYMSLMLN